MKVAIVERWPLEGGNAGGKLLFPKTLFLAHESVPLGKKIKKKKETRKIKLDSIEHCEQFVKYKYVTYLRIYLSTKKQNMMLQNKQ